LSNKSIVDTLRYSSNYRLRREIGLRLKGYLETATARDNSTLMPEGACSINISNLAKIGGGLWNDVYSFNLSYKENQTTRNIHLILKIYLRGKDPYDLIRKKYAYSPETSKWMREFHLLRNLGSIGFHVPKVYLCEFDSRFLGYPFLIMQKEEFVKKPISETVDCFATTLANLHNIKQEALGNYFLRTPKSESAYAKSWPIYYKQYLNLQPKHSKRMRNDFLLAIQWLDLNASKNKCSKYCLVHGDYHPGNVCVTRDSRFVVLDWDSIEIGDPALDVGYAYHFVKFFSNPENPNSAESIAKRFVSEYTKNFEGDITERLDYYKMVGILGTSIFYSSGLSYPIYAYYYHRRKVLTAFPLLSGLAIFLAFPFIKWPFVAHQFAVECDLLWLKYFENFLETTLKR